MKLGWYSNILLEADEKKKEETEEDGDDYQLDDRPETEEELNTDDEPDPTSEITGDEDGTEEPDGGDDYQLDERPDNEEDLVGDPDPTDAVTGDEDGTEDPDGVDDYQLDGDGTDDGTEEDIDGENPEDINADDELDDGDTDKKEKYKKMILLDDYRELYNISINLQKSCENLNDKTNIKNKRLYNYLDIKIDQVVEKISFTIRVLFLSEDYKKLLTLFYHYKIQINDIVKLFEFLIQSEEE